MNIEWIKSKSWASPTFIRTPVVVGVVLKIQDMIDVKKRFKENTLLTLLDPTG